MKMIPNNTIEANSVCVKYFSNVCASCSFFFFHYVVKVLDIQDKPSKNLGVYFSLNPCIFV